MLAWFSSSQIFSSIAARLALEVFGVVVRIAQRVWTTTDGWTEAEPHIDAQVVFVFGDTELLASGSLLDEVAERHPGAEVLGCSTAGEICGTRVLDNTVVSTAVAFEHTSVRVARETLDDASESFATGRRLSETLRDDRLAHVFVVSDGLLVNGSELVRGLSSALPRGVQVTGGLAGDGERFERTLVVVGGDSQPGTIVAIGLYGERIQVGYGSLGGWDPFGPERLITRSDGNVLYELDDRSALDLYKQYLGNYADGLPATGLLFPLSLRAPDGEESVVRTILAVDEPSSSMTFAGDLPEGHYARFMKANFERLIDGATHAAETSARSIDGDTELALLISCVGRKMVLKQRVEEEVEGVREIVGEGAVLTGFYSYGEISPFTPGADCALHNQTMTITTFCER